MRHISPKVRPSPLIVPILRLHLNSFECQGRSCCDDSRPKPTAKSLDWSSNLQEQVSPYYGAEYGVSAFDIKHDFVLSYNYELPFAKVFRGVASASADDSAANSSHDMTGLSNASHIWR
jgi:hypothetical protein